MLSERPSPGEVVCDLFGVLAAIKLKAESMFVAVEVEHKASPVSKLDGVLAPELRPCDLAIA
jgi:hypothetical protein